MATYRGEKTSHKTCSICTVLILKGTPCFSVPKHEFENWKKIIPHLERNGKLCGLHFDDNDISKGVEIQGTFHHAQRIRLRKNAVPKHHLSMFVIGYVATFSNLFVLILQDGPKRKWTALKAIDGNVHAKRKKEKRICTTHTSTKVGKLIISFPLDVHYILEFLYLPYFIQLLLQPRVSFPNSWNLQLCPDQLTSLGSTINFLKSQYFIHYVMQHQIRVNYPNRRFLQPRSLHPLKSQLTLTLMANFLDSWYLQHYRSPLKNQLISQWSTINFLNSQYLQYHLISSKDRMILRLAIWLTIYLLNSPYLQHHSLPLKNQSIPLHCIANLINKHQNNPQLYHLITVSSSVVKFHHNNINMSHCQLIPVPLKRQQQVIQLSDQYTR